MKAMVLCAGMGTRLGELTSQVPKPMLRLGDHPMLAYVLGHLRAQGIRQIVINLHFHPEAIRAPFGDGRRWGIELTYSEESALLGTAGGVKRMADYFRKEPEFLVQYGDVVTEQDFAAMVGFHRERRALATLLVHERQRSNSVIALDHEGRIEAFLERPTEAERSRVNSSWVNSGVYVLDPAILDRVPENTPADWPRDVFPRLVSGGRLFGFPLSGYRCAVDSPQRLEEARAAVATGRCRIQPLANGSSAGVSVIVPNYNHAQYLPRALNALLRQSLPPAEILVVNDGSTDNSLEVLGEFARQHPLLRIVNNEQNLGVVRSMNRGLELAASEFVFFSEADDEVRPGLLERSVCRLQAHPQAGLCSSLSEWRCKASGLAWPYGGGMPDRAGYLSPDDMVALGRRGRLAISGPNMVFRKGALVGAGGWIPELRWFCDLFGAYTVGFRHGMCHLPEVLAEFNLDPGSYYHRTQGAAERRAVMDRLLRLLASAPYADVAPRMRDSGILGTLGWPMLRVALGTREHRGFVTWPFLRQAGRRTAEVIGRRCFPAWLARWCLRVFYGH